MHGSGGSCAAALDAEAGGGIQPLPPKGIGRVAGHIDGVMHPAAAPERSGPRSVGAEFLTADHGGVDPLVAFRVRQMQATQRDQQADLVEAVAPLHSATRRIGGPVVHDIGLGTAGLAAGGDVVDCLAPTGAGAGRHCLPQRAPDGVNDLMRDEDGTHGQRRGRARVHHRAIGRHDLDGAERTLIARQVRVEEGRECHVDSGMGIGERRVLETAHLRVGAGEIHLHPVICHGERHADLDVALLEAVIVGDLRGAVGAARQFLAGLPETLVGIGQQSIEIARTGFPSQFGDQLRQTLRTDAGGADHGAQIAVQQFRRAAVEQQQLPEVVAHFATLEQFQRWQADAFMEDLGGLGIVGAGRAATDVGLMRPVAGPGRQLPIDEYRAADHPVRQMIATGDVRIVRQEDVVRFDPPGESVNKGAHGEATTAGMDRNAVGLADQGAAGIGNETGKIMALVEDRAARGARHDEAHLVSRCPGSRLSEACTGTSAQPVAASTKARR